jgi:hypothetical protein
MDHDDGIRARLTGTPTEQARREEILQAILGAFARGGSDAVGSELKSRLDAIERTFDLKLSALSAIMS